MKRKRLFRALRQGLFCLAASALIWSWIFTFLTDTDHAHKIVLYADMGDFAWRELAVTLEEKAPEGIRFVQAHPFTYALMNSADLEQADLYVLTAAQAEEYASLLAPVPDALRGSPLLRTMADGAQGLILYEAASGRGIAGSMLRYAEQPDADWYLFFGARSPHLSQEPPGLDTAAVETARQLIQLEQKD